MTVPPGRTRGTAASISFIVGTDAAFVHDTLMYPDSGTSRADFPGADPVALYRSIQEILAFPGATRLFVGHDYRKDGRAARAWSQAAQVPRITRLCAVARNWFAAAASFSTSSSRGCANSIIVLQESHRKWSCAG